MVVWGVLPISFALGLVAGVYGPRVAEWWGQRRAARRTGLPEEFEPRLYTKSEFSSPRPTARVRKGRIRPHYRRSHFR